MRNAILFASDLDNTLLYSYRHKQANNICVEKIVEKEQGFMPPYTYYSLSTRSKRALDISARIRLKQGAK